MEIELHDLLQEYCNIDLKNQNLPTVLQKANSPFIYLVKKTF